MLDALWARVLAIPEEGFDQVMADEALDEAERLAALVKADRDDVKARYCLGWIYFSRFPGLPDEEGRSALTEAVSMFVPCFLKGETPDLPAASLPEPVMPQVLISAALHTAVLALESKEAADPDGLATAATQWKLIVDATPPDDHDLPSYLNHLGTTLTGLYRLSEDPDTLDAAIDAFERASAVMAADDPQRASHWAVCATPCGSGTSARRPQRTSTRPSRRHGVRRTSLSRPTPVTGTEPASPIS
ncbi:hypothetical protein H0E86_31315 [Streptomyces sp. SCSIO-PteL053]|nr:hypothetical protein H0E86_31315 [Streptomyces sp. SCSIO-PteL053]